MPWVKKGARLGSCTIADSALARRSVADENDQTSSMLEEDEEYLKERQAMSELQIAVLKRLIPLTPCAIHSADLYEAVAPLLKGRNKKERRREFEAAVAPLVEKELVRYFCCMIDSYAINPRHIGTVRYLADKKPDD